MGNRHERADHVLVNHADHRISIGSDRDDADDRFPDRIIDELSGLEARGALVLTAVHRWEADVAQ